MKSFVRKLNLVLLSVLLAAVLVPGDAAAADTCQASIPVRVQVVPETEVPFTLRLEGEDQAPMPAQDTLSFSGSGAGAFGPIVYSIPQDYRYTIRQVPGSDAGVTYDDTVFTILVRVTEALDGSLSPEIWGVRDGESEKIQEIVFYNRYAEPTPEAPDPEDPTPDEKPEDPSEPEEPTPDKDPDDPSDPEDVPDPETPQPGEDPEHPLEPEEPVPDQDPEDGPEPEEPAADEEGEDAPKTGDDAPVAWLVGLAAAAAVGLLLLVLLPRRPGDQEKS